MPKKWKDTLNLPQTAFSMRANLQRLEPALLNQWEESDLYQQILSNRKNCPSFIFHDGPPYANGQIHHGHILNKVLKDIAVKFHWMTGHYCEFIPGWDCHGLPIEHQVEKKLGKKMREMSQVEIRNACRDYAERFVGIQRDGFKRLGILADWDNPYTTLEYYYESAVVRELGKLIEKGLVYKALKAVHWSFGARSALAEAEVEYAPFTAPSIYVKFPFQGQVPSFLTKAANGLDIHVVIWTTTPWTLPSNLAIALHPELEYQLVEVDGVALILAEGLTESVYENCNIDKHKTLLNFKGSDLVGTAEVPLKPAARHPFIDRESVLLPALHVTLDQGTGCVHTAPGHGQEDYELGLEHGLDILSPIDDLGRYTSEVPEYQGQHVFKVNPLIVERLHETGVLLNQPGDSVVIERYPHCWRTKKPVIFRATPQWFIKVEDDNLRAHALKAVDETHWIPSWGKERIQGMLEHRPDWCISRQRVWGVPIPALTCQQCGEVTLDERVAFKLADLTADEGVDCWFTRDVSELVPENFTCPHCNSGTENFSKEKDILDVWFESGASFAAVLESRTGCGPIADLYLEGSDQHRGWFQSSLLIGVGTRGHAPFRTVLTHGFVVDEAGHKYSKSSKNFESPDKIINSHGVEILRLWVAAVEYRGDITLSPEILQRMVDAYRRIRNTARFLLGNLADFDPEKHLLDIEQLTPLDRWSLDNLAQLIDRLINAYGKYEYHAVFHRLLEFCTVDLSQNYLDVLKDRLYVEHPDDPRRRASQTVLYESLRALVLLAAPILSFTCEEIWQHLPKRKGDPESVHLAQFPDSPPQSWRSDTIKEEFDNLFKIKRSVHEAIELLRPKKKGERQPGQIGSSQEAVVTLSGNDVLLNALRPKKSLLEDLLIVSRVEFTEGVESEVPGVRVTLAEGSKCPRCWYIRNNMSDAEHPELCARCAGVVSQLSHNGESTL
jgi:isoleucyl-tRNA synthetase